MADPFSIAAGSASLAEISWRVVIYLKNVQAVAARVEDELATLSKEIESLISVNSSLEDVWASEQKASLATSVADTVRVESIWQNVGTNLQDCRVVVEKLDGLLKGVTGKAGLQSAGKFDNLKKQLRRQSKDEEFRRLRDSLTTHQNSLQLLLTALNVFYTRSSRNATDLSLGHLSEDVQLLGFKLKSQIASLRPRLNHHRQLGSVSGDYKNASNTLQDCISAAAAEASFVSLNEHFYIPQPVSSIFTGREEQLQELQDALDVVSSQDHSHVQNRFVIYGLGGSGKTQFCCKYAQVNRENFWGIFTIDALTLKSAQHSFARIAKIAGVEPNDRAVKNWLSNLNRPWLLLIDNADDSSVSIEQYFPEGHRGFILVTTRNPSNRVHGTLKSKFYHFERLEISQAADLLLKAACEPQPWIPYARKLAGLIAEKLGALPLALVYAGKAIMSRLCSLEDYLDFYAENWQRIRRARNVAGYRGNEDINMNVYSSYEVLYQNLEATRTEECQDAVDLLKIFSFLYCENIRVNVLISAATNPRLETEAAEKGKDNRMEPDSKTKSLRCFIKELGFSVLEASMRDRSPSVLPPVLRDNEASVSFQEIRLRLALKELAQISFITHQQTTGSYSMHPLVHTWVRERPKMSIGEQAIWCEAASTLVAQCILLPPLGSTEEHEDLRKDLLPHVIHVQEQQAIIRKRFDDNMKARKRPWPVVKPTFGRQQALRLAKFSLVYSQCGLWNEAESLQVVVKDFACKMLGMEHPSTIEIMLALAGTHFHQTHYNAAADLQDQVLKACMSSLGPDDRKTLKVMDILGATRSHQGRFRESLELHQRSVDGMTKTLGADQEDTLLALDHLGKIQWWYFRFDEARELHTQAVAGMKTVLGPTHLSTLQAMENLACAYLNLRGELLWHAHDLMSHVLDQRKKKLGREHPYTLLSICNLAKIKSALEHHEEAEGMLRAAWPIAVRNLGENHFGTVAGKANLARILARQKKYSEAEDLLMGVIKRQNYVAAARADGEHPDRITGMYFLLECYQLQGRIDDAIRVADELFECLSKIGGQGLGLLHPFTKRLLVTRAELQAANNTFGADRARILEGIQPILP